MCLFLKIIKEGLNNFVPKKYITCNSSPPWYNKELTKMKNKKTKAHKRFREDKSNLILKNIYIHSQKNFDVLGIRLDNKVKQTDTQTKS